MEITDVRVKLLEDAEDKLRAFCTVTFGDEFVIRDVKVIESLVRVSRESSHKSSREPTRGPRSRR